MFLPGKYTNVMCKKLALQKGNVVGCIITREKQKVLDQKALWEKGSRNNQIGDTNVMIKWEERNKTM